MGRFTLRLPKTLHQEIEVLAKDEGISLNQYIVYALTQQVTLAKLALEKDQALTPEKAKLLANVKLMAPDQVAGQYEAFEALLSRLGEAASDKAVERYLSEREPVKPEADLKPEAVSRFKEWMRSANQSG